MTLDLEAVCEQITHLLSDDGVVRPQIAMEALVVVTATMILVFAKDDPVAGAEQYGELVTNMVAGELADFPDEFRAVLQ